MKMTMTDGTVFEGTLKEYAELIAFAETHQAVNEAKVEAEYVPQEGDIVVITANTNGSRNKVGDIGKVTEIREFSDGKCIRVHVNGRENFGNWTRPTEYRKATPAEVEAYEKAVADASKPKLKAGDTVIFTANKHEHKTGKIAVIRVIEGDGTEVVSIGLNDLNGESSGWADVSVLRRATEEEVSKYADEAKWAKIGRKVDEYKAGDIIEYGADASFRKPAKLYEVAEIDGNKVRFYCDVYGNETEFMPADSKSIRLITPVESTLN